MRCLYLLIILTVNIGFSQTREGDLSFTGSVVNGSVIRDRQLGFDVMAKYYFKDEFAVGAEMYRVARDYDTGFMFKADKTNLSITHISIPLYFNVINEDLYGMTAAISNGVLIANLKNKGANSYTFVPNPEVPDQVAVGQLPKKLGTDVYYAFTFSIEGWLKFARFSRDSGMYLTPRAGYQYAFGDGTFTGMRDLTDFVVTLGVTYKFNIR